MFLLMKEKTEHALNNIIVGLATMALLTAIVITILDRI